MSEDWAEAVERCVKTVSAYFSSKGMDGFVQMADVLDALQTAAMELLANIEKGKIVVDERGIYPLLKMTTIRRVLDKHRASQRNPALPNKKSLAEQSCPSPTPEEILELREHQAHARDIIGELYDYIMDQDDEDALEWLSVMEEHEGQLKPRERCRFLKWEKDRERRIQRRVRRYGKHVTMASHRGVGDGR
jgi:hypothetical protein